MGVQLEEPEVDDPSYTFMGYNMLSVARLRCPCHWCLNEAHATKSPRCVAGMAVAHGTSPRC